MAVAIEEGLPPKALWPERIYTLPETRYPVRLNVATALLDANADGGRAGRPAVLHQDEMVRGSSLVESHRFGATCVHGRMRGMRMLRRNGRRAIRAAS